MIIAEEKLKENIAEYIIYMYQIEDLIRAKQFDIALIDQSIINQFDLSYEKKRDMLEWYKGLIHDMIAEKKQRIGHISLLTDITDQLHSINLNILHKPENADFKNTYDRAKVDIDALRMRSGHGHDSDVQLSMNGLYGLLILRIQKKEISEETTKAFESITKWISLLSAEYMNSNGKI